MNRFGKSLPLLLASWLLPALAWGQLQITFPASRAVFQRNNSNKAILTVAGTYTQYLDRIEARAVPRVSGQGAATAWDTLQLAPLGGVFSGKLTVSGGWYQLEVRGWLGTTLVASTTLDRVGVGEVFAFIGNSNAQGTNANGPSAQDDRVSCVPVNTATFDQFNATGKADYLSIGSFARITANTGMAPYSGSPWFWGQLGDLLVQKLNVPVLFYAAGFGGSTTEQWYLASQGAQFQHPFINSAIRMPYILLKDIFNTFVPLTGLRGVLSLHGESDRFVSSAQIQFFTRQLIAKSREDADKPNLAWMVARSSYVGGANPNVIEGQNLVIQFFPNVFAGPNLDLIGGPENRSEGVNYTSAGQTKVAQAWADALNADFFTKSQPYPGVAPPLPSVACAANGSLTFSLPAGFSGYAWSNGATTAATTIPATGGQLSARLTDAKGNFYAVPPLVFSAATLAARPSIIADGPLRLCAKTNVTLTSSSPYPNVWNTGATTRSITINSGGTYSLSTKNIFGCAVTSTPLVISIATASNLPPPLVTPSGPTAFCQGNEVTLTSSYSGTTVWSDGTTARSITVSDPGAYTARALDAGGCGSGPSSPVAVTVFSLPEPPLVTSDKFPSLCAGTGTVTLTAPTAQGYAWSTGATTRSIIVASSGAYSVRVTDARRCVSPPSAETMVSFRAVPTRPQLAQVGTYTLEARATNATDYEWRRNDALITFSTATLKAGTDGTYSVRGRAEYAETPPLIKLVCFSEKRDTTLRFTPESVNAGLSVYPNPSRSGLFTIETLRNWASGEISVFTASGHAVYRQAVNGFEERLTVDLSRQPGLYLLRVTAEGFDQTKRLFYVP